jgi:hypothetical protein
MKTKLRFFGIVLCLCTAATVARAQETRASLSGIVTDQSGSVVSRATIHLTNVETSVVFTATANPLGQYRFLFLNPGKYKLIAEMAGFKTFERDNIELSVNEAATLPVTLEVGAQTERITVSAEAPLLEAEKSDRGMVVDNQKVVDLPINTRNPIMLAALANGITATSGATLDQKPFSNSADGSWSINGGVGSTVEFLLDGAPNNTVYNGLSTVANVPSVDAVQEFKVMTTSYDAQYGHTGGGAINVSLKSGTNTFHGSVYEFLKRPSLNANTFSDNAHGSPLPANGLDQYGFTIGGPVDIPKVYKGKDHTFFFFALEQYREDQEYPAEKIASVPTAAQRSGDFSNTETLAGQMITIYDPQTGHADSSGNWIRAPFPGNIIPGGRINPVAAKVLALYPLPNTTTSGSPAWQNNYYWADNIANFHFKNVMARVDHSFSARERVYARWSWSNFDQVRIENAIPGVAGDHRFGGKYSNGGVVDSVTTLSSGTLLDLRASLSYWDENVGPPASMGFNATQIGWPASLVSQLPNSYLFPDISVAGATTLGQSSGNVTFEPTTVLSLGPNVALIRGRHTIKAGLDFRVTRYTQYRPTTGGGSLSFTNTFTQANYLTGDAFSGNGAASLLLGYAASGSVGYTADPFFQWLYYAPWVQDDIKVARRLTLNFGLRWDITTPVTERFNELDRDFFASQVNPISSQINQTAFSGMKVYGGIGFVGQNGLPRSPYNIDLKDFQPRIGAAYQIGAKTVLRGGWGIFDIMRTDTGQTSGFSQSTPFVGTQDSGRTPFNTISNPFPTGLLQPAGASTGMSTFLGQGVTFVNPAVRNPYVHQFSFGIQRELPGNMSVEASYVGSRTLRALTSKSIDYLSLANLALGDSTQGGNPNYLNAQVPNPFQNLVPGTTINGATISRSQSLLPFPEFTGVTENNLNTGKIWYNSLQVSLQKRYSHGLAFAANYNFSKNISAISYLNSQDAAPTRSLTAFDRPQRLAFSPIYELPFGPGRLFLRSKNGVLKRLVGGWQVNVSVVFQSGAPMSEPSSVTVLGDPRLASPTWLRMFKTGYIDANGVTHNVLPGEQPVFQIRQPDTLRTTPLYWGNLRDPWGPTYDASLVKNTRIREGMNCQFRFEAFNVDNHPQFAEDPNLTPTSTTFGEIIRGNGQTNAARSLQFGFRFTF